MKKIICMILTLFLLTIPIYADTSELHGNVYFKAYRDYEGFDISHFEVNPYFKINYSKLKYIYFKYGLNFKNYNHEYHYFLWGAEVEAPILDFITIFAEFQPIIMFEGNTSGLPAGERSTQAIGMYLNQDNGGQIRAELRKETNGDWLNEYSKLDYLNIDFWFIKRFYSKYSLSLFSPRGKGYKVLKPYMTNVSYGGEFNICGYTQRIQIGARKYIDQVKNNWDIIYVFTSGIKF